MDKPRSQVHHILAEIIQGGIVLETNLEEIDSACKSFSSWVTPFLVCFFVGRHLYTACSLVVSGFTARSLIQPQN